VAAAGIIRQGPYVAQANVCVIPLFVGSGTRIKAFEAMAMGRPVVSTTLGMEGLGVTDGENFVRADDDAAFARSILTLMGDAPMRARIAAAARRLMEERFSWPAVRGDLSADSGSAVRGASLEKSFRRSASCRGPHRPCWSGRWGQPGGR
jgi:hypothetical protein